MKRGRDARQPHRAGLMDNDFLHHILLTGGNHLDTAGRGYALNRYKSQYYSSYV